MLFLSENVTVQSNSKGQGGLDETNWINPEPQLSLEI